MVFRKHIYVIVCWISVFFINSLSAQELELFEVDDYLNPEHLKISMSGKPKSVLFFTSRIFVGIDKNYQYRNNIVNPMVDFQRITNSFYYSNYQFNIKLTRLHLLDESNNPPNIVPEYKGRLQFGFYIDTDSKDKNDEPGRFQISWGFEKWKDQKLIHEFSWELDVSFLGDKDTPPFTGGLIYAWTSWGSGGEDYLGLAYRYKMLQWANGSNLKWGIGFSGGAINDDWYYGTTRNEISSEIYIPFLKCSINLIYSVSYMSRQKTWNHEFGLFFDAPLFSKLFR